MNKIKTILLLCLTSIAFAAPVKEMNKVFNAFADLVPYLSHKPSFLEKKNEKVILGKLENMKKAFNEAGHDTLLKKDLFAPSYKLVSDNITGTVSAFKEGKKEFAHWRLKEITNQCLECHTRLPISYASSFQNGDLKIDPKKYSNLYDLGIAQMIVRRYDDAKATFLKAGDEKSLKEIQAIDIKILNKDGPVLKNDKEVNAFLKSKNFKEGADTDMLKLSGVLSRYLFQHPETKLAPEISYWIGYSEKVLKRANFFGSGDLFLKQCIRRYPKSKIAKECLAEYKESVEFDFTGSAGTDIPLDVQNELKELEKLVK